MANLTHESSVEKLDGLFTRAYDLSKSYFAGDLPKDARNGISILEDLRKLDIISNNGIPLPSSNSPEAKQMRIAAVLAVLGHNFATYIFQPFYLVDGTEFSEFLSDLASEDPKREAFLRSALLATITAEEQKATTHERTEIVLDMILPAVKTLLEDGNRDSFRKALGELCQHCCETWSEIQRLEDRVDGSTHVDIPALWDLLELPHIPQDTGSTSGGSKPTRQANGTASPAQRPDSKASQPTVNAENIGNIVGAVWPSFYFIREGRRELLRKGSALDDAQVKIARIEASATGHARDARRRARTFSTPRPASAGDKTRQGFFVPEWIRRPAWWLILKTRKRGSKRLIR